MDIRLDQDEEEHLKESSGSDALREIASGDIRGNSSTVDIAEL